MVEIAERTDYTGPELRAVRERLHVPRARVARHYGGGASRQAIENLEAAAAVTTARAVKYLAALADAGEEMAAELEAAL